MTPSQSRLPATLFILSLLVGAFPFLVNSISCLADLYVTVGTLAMGAPGDFVKELDRSRGLILLRPLWTLVTVALWVWMLPRWKNPNRIALGLSWLLAILGFKIYEVSCSQLGFCF